MVKKYGDLYLDTRRELLAQEDPQIAGMMARQLLSHVSGKTQDAILNDRELYASDEVCKGVEKEKIRTILRKL